MNYSELEAKINNGDYDSKLPFPPYRPDPMDRSDFHAVDLEAKRAWREDEQRLKEVFKADLKKYAESELGKPLNSEQFDAIFHWGWEDGHSCGYHEVLICADHYIEVVKKFV